jgi:hypothetical protein
MHVNTCQYESEYMQGETAQHTSMYIPRYYYVHNKGLTDEPRTPVRADELSVR